MNLTPSFAAPIYSGAQPLQQTTQLENEASSLNNPLTLGYVPSPNPSLVGNGNPIGLSYQNLPSYTNLGQQGYTYPGISKTNDTTSFYLNVGETEGKETRKERNTMVASFKRQQDKLPDQLSEYIIIGTLSDKIKKKIAVVECTTPGTKGSKTINDPKMGVVPGNTTCTTCKMTLGICPGHFGLIKLNPTLDEPSYIYHPSFISDVERILGCVCHDCGTLRVTKEQIEAANLDYLTGYERLRAISDYCKRAKGLPCPGTNVRKYMAETGQSDIIKCKVSPILETKKKDRENGNLMIKLQKGKAVRYAKFSIIHAYSILDKITDEDKILLGFGENSHPRDLILNTILVIPPAYRGASISIPGTHSQDKIGDQYSQIVRENEKLLGDDGLSKKEDYLKTIYQKYSDLLSNTIDKTKSRKNQFSGLMSMLRTKKGIFRSIALGKRVDFTARSVIGPNPDLSVEEVGIPITWRKYLSIPVVVTFFNKKSLTIKLKSGLVTSVRRSGAGYNTRITSKNQYTFKLSIGDTCNRWLENGDYVTLNRQPSIHKRSIMGMIVKLVDSLNIQLNPSYTTPFNADFDGDEMNIHVPQTPEARTELMVVMALKHCLLDEQANLPMMGLIMSDITSAYLLTLLNPVIEPKTRIAAMSMIKQTDQLSTLDARLNEENIRKFSGYGYFSMILPETLYYNKGGVIIRNGVLVSGVITKKHIGKSGNSIFQVVEKDFGSDRAVRLLDDMSKILNRFLSSYGFSIGLESCTSTDSRVMEIKESQLAIMKDLVMLFGTRLEDPDEEMRRKREIIALLDKPKQMSMKILTDTFGMLNAQAIMIISGAKAGPFNAAQMSVMLGQVYKEGEIFMPSITNQSRALPVFQPHDPSPEAFGFIPRSFNEGLKPSHMYFHAAGTRENLADTALKTANVGKLSRDMNFAIGDYKIMYDGTVRDSQNNIIQFIYGDDGFNPAHLESLNINGDNLAFFINLTRVIRSLNQKYGYSEFQQYQPPQSMIDLISQSKPLYVPPSDQQQINVLLQNDGLPSVRTFINKYVNNIATSDTLLINYQQDSQLYDNISANYLELQNKMIDDYIDFTKGYAYFRNRKYLHLGNKSFAENFGSEKKYLNYDIFSLDDPDRSFDGQSLNFNDNMFYFVSAIDFINHYGNIVPVLNEITRVLDTGGYLLIKEFDVNTDIDRLYADVDHMLLYHLAGKYNDLVDQYVGNYQPKNTLSKLLQELGFTRIKEKNIDDKSKSYLALYQLTK